MPQPDRPVGPDAIAIRAALERAGLSPEQVDYVFMGQVLLGGAGQMTARQAAVKGGIGMGVPATTINKVCPSGMAAIALARQTIALGEADVVVAGGMESMSNAPYVLPKARTGYRMGSAVPSGTVPRTSSVAELTTASVPDPVEGTHSPPM